MTPRHPWDIASDRLNAAIRAVRDGAETPAEDIRNALAILDTLDPNNAALDEVAARLSSALEKLESPSAVKCGPARAIVGAHPGVPASLYMLSE